MPRNRTLNAGKYNHFIAIYQDVRTYDEAGLEQNLKTLVLACRAAIKTTKGWTLIASGSDFEAATTNFTIRAPKAVTITREMQVYSSGKWYSIQYLNNVDEAGEELEIQAKEVTM